MMKRLTGLDGVTLHGETSVMPTHVTAVLFCDSEARGKMTAAAIYQLLAERTAATPGFRQRLLTRAFGLGQPSWIEDPAFDVHSHLHCVRLAKPGTMRELTTLIGELHGQPLDRRRPLWDAWVVQGLADGRLVVLIKFSHAITDGVGAVTSMLPELMTVDAHAEFAAEPEHARATKPRAAARVWDAVDEVASNTAVGIRIAGRLGPVAVKSVVGTALGSVRRLLPGIGPQRPDCLDSEEDENSPRTQLNAPLTARRSVAFATLAMDDLRAITAAFDVTVNDVFLTATTSALRRWLATYDTVPSHPLRTMMPISTRGIDGNASNSWSPVLVKLPVNLADPAQQLASIHDATSRIKDGRRAVPPVNLADVIDLVPPAVIAMAMGVYTALKLSRFHSPVAHVITSNVPGPSDEIYCAGAHVLGMHAMAPLFEGSNLNITAVSYGDTLAVGIVACPDNVDDVASIASDIEDVLVELKIAADQKTGQSASSTTQQPNNRNEATMRNSDNAKRNTFRENVFHVGAGFLAKERPHVTQTLSTLEAHLGRWDSNDVDIEVTLQDRGGKEQRITLRTTLPGHPLLVAVADNPDITRALCDAKRELTRQLEHQKATHDPMNNRRLRRATIRHPV